MTTTAVHFVKDLMYRYEHEFLPTAGKQIYLQKFRTMFNDVIFNNSIMC